MKELKIEAPEGYEIDKENSTFELVRFKKIETGVEWGDFGKVDGFYIDTVGDIDFLAKEDANSSNTNTWPTKEEAEACLALSQLCQWRDKYNEGWKPDWSDGNQDKYVIYYCSNKPFLSQNIDTQRTLSFKTSQIRDKFMENFTDLITTAKPLL